MGTYHRLIGIGRIPLLQLISSLGIRNFESWEIIFLLSRIKNNSFIFIQFSICY